MLSNAKFINIRSSKGRKGKKKVYAKGYASTKGLYDKYAWMKNGDGSYKSFRSLFTDDCIEDMRKQAMTKTIFVDAQHTIATDIGIIKILEDSKASKEEIEQAKEMLKMKKLPLAKPVEFDIDDYGFLFASETNPWFAEVDSEHEKYYDAITNSIVDGYIKGYSINFDPIEFDTTTDEGGNEWTQFKKVNLYGISLTDNPALETNLFTEVAMRSMMQVRSEKGGKMEEQKEEVVKAEESQKPEVQNAEVVKSEPKQPDVDSIVEQKVKEKIEEKEQKDEVKKQEETQKNSIEDLQKQIEELRNDKSDGPKGIVQQQDKFKEIQGGEENPLQDKEKFKEELKKITSDHDLYMEDLRKGTHPSLCRGQFFSGWAEMIQIGADLRSHTFRQAGESDEAYRGRMIMIGRNADDDVVIKRTRQV